MKKKPIEMRVRKFWIINPVERVKQSKKIYNRKEGKMNIKKLIKQKIIWIFFIGFLIIPLSYGWDNKEDFIGLHKIDEIPLKYRNRVKNIVLKYLIKALEYHYRLNCLINKFYGQFGYNTNRIKVIRDIEGFDRVIYKTRKNKFILLAKIKVPAKLRMFTRFEILYYCGSKEEMEKEQKIIRDWMVVHYKKILKWDKKKK